MAQDASQGDRGRLRSLGRALRHRNYRLFFLGQTVSLVGSWMTRVATSWLVYRLTGSAVLLGIVGFAGQIPTFFLAPFAGVMVDRWNRHRVLVATQIAAMLQSALLAVLALTGVITVTHVVVLSVVQGVINVLDMPARQSFVVEMIEDRSDLPNAIALNSSMVNAARLAGPSIAGVIIAASGEGICFTIDAVSYLAVIASLLAMRLPPQKSASRPSKHVLQELREGLAYAAGFAPIRSLLLLLAFFSLMGMPYTVLMPMIAADMLHGGPGTLGWLMASSGLGALVGALYLASRSTVLGLGRVIVAAGLAFGVGLVIFSRAESLWLSLVVMLLTGAGMMVLMASSNTIVQTITDEDKRGRVMSLYTMAFLGTAPFGSLLAGFAAARFGAPSTLLVCGVLCIGCALLFARKLPELREAVRPVYRRLGVLPEIARGLDGAASVLPPSHR